MKACCLCLAGVAAFAVARAEHVGKFESVGKAVAAFATGVGQGLTPMVV